jgi:hypothetical protein
MYIVVLFSSIDVATTTDMAFSYEAMILVWLQYAQ